MLCTLSNKKSPMFKPKINSKFLDLFLQTNPNQHLLKNLVAKFLLPVVEFLLVQDLLLGTNPFLFCKFLWYFVLTFSNFLYIVLKHQLIHSIDFSNFEVFSSTILRSFSILLILLWELLLESFPNKLWHFDFMGSLFLFLTISETIIGTT